MDPDSDDALDTVAAPRSDRISEKRVAGGKLHYGRDFGVPSLRAAAVSMGVSQEVVLETAGIDQDFINGLPPDLRDEVVSAELCHLNMPTQQSADNSANFVPPARATLKSAAAAVVATSSMVSSAPDELVAANGDGASHEWYAGCLFDMLTASELDCQDIDRYKLATADALLVVHKGRPSDSMMLLSANLLANHSVNTFFVSVDTGANC